MLDGLALEKGLSVSPLVGYLLITELTDMVSRISSINILWRYKWYYFPLPPLEISFFYGIVQLQALRKSTYLQPALTRMFSNFVIAAAGNLILHTHGKEPSHPFSCRDRNLTGNVGDLRVLVEEHGGRYSEIIDDETTHLICGAFAYKSKTQKGESEPLSNLFEVKANLLIYKLNQRWQ